MSMINRLWVEKYRPKTLDEYIWQDDTQKKQILRFIAEGEIPHLLLSGIQGSGKTTLSKIIVNLLIEEDYRNTDVMLINASDENSVDTIREKIQTFAGGYSMGKFKIVQLEEMDYLTHNAQAVLRQVMEECSDTCRFIGTCNYDNKIIPALKSRMQEFNFRAPDRTQILGFVANMLADEGVTVATQEDIDNINSYIDIAYPDIRKLINILNQNVIDGVLPKPVGSDKNTDAKFALLDHIQRNDFWGFTQLVEKIGHDEYEDVYRFLMDNIQKASKFQELDQQKAAIVTIGKYLNQHYTNGQPDLVLRCLFTALDML